MKESVHLDLEGLMNVRVEKEEFRERVSVFRCHGDKCVSE